MTTTDPRPARAQRRSDPGYVSPLKSVVWGGSGISMAASVMMLGWLSLYATDTLGLSAATIGFMIAGCQFLNVLGSLAAAYIVDRSPVTRWGKARPYEIAIPVVWLATIALFATPASFDTTARTIWIGVMFVLIQGVFDPFLRANDALYTVRAFANRDQWSKVIAVSGFVTMVGVLPMAILMPILLNSAGKDPGRWIGVVAVVAIVMTVVGLLRFFVVKEKHGTADDAEPPVRIAELVAAVRANRWIWLYSTLPFIVSAASTSTALGYYFRYIVGDLSVLGIMGMFSIVVLPIMLFLPRLMRRVAVSQIIMGGAVLGIIGNVVSALAWGNVTVVLVGGFLTGLGMLPAAYLQAILVLDLCSYNEWKGNRRLESTIGALTGIFGRLGTAFVAGLTGAVLSGVGYDGTQEAQSAGALVAINALAFWVPAILMTTLAITMLVYGRFDRGLLPRIRAELAARRGDEGQAEAEADATVGDLVPGPIVVPGAGPVGAADPALPSSASSDGRE